MDLITQQNTLRGLSEEQLRQTLSAGNTPPFLVLGEINRRTEMRKAYEGERARRGFSSTVFEELTGGQQPPDPTMSGMRMPQTGQQPPSALSTMADGGLVMAYAEGGLVRDPFKDTSTRTSSSRPGISRPSSGSGGLADLIARYEENLSEIDSRKNDAIWLAVAAAGANMMSGKSSNFLTNVGGAVDTGIGAYRAFTDDIDADEQAGLDALLRLQTTAGDIDYRERAFAADEQYRRQQLDMDRRRLFEDPASVKEHKYFMSLDPEQQAEYLRLNPGASASTDYAEIARRQNAFKGVYDDAVKAAKEAAKIDILSAAGDVEAQAALIQQIEAQALQKALADFKVLYPEYAEWAQVYGETLASSGTVAPGASLVDPLGIGL